MGSFRVAIQVGDLAGSQFTDVEAIVDTGASDTVVPADILTQSGIRPVERRPYELADNSIVEYEVGYARVRLDGREVLALIVFGTAAMLPLLGASTLEVAHLGVDPVGKRLIPVRGLLL